MSDDRPRCAWITDPLMLAYHDREWGVPVHDDGKHFEFLLLDAFQAGLSWALILRKRENFRRAFDDFDPGRIARWRAARVARLLRDAGIVRNRLKIEATVTNARAFLDLQERHGDFDRFIWSFVDGATKHNAWRSLRELPARTRDSDRMSKALKAEGFKFVGSTICYSYMQAAGLVNDHVVSCFRHRQLRGRGTRAARSR